MIHVEPFEPSHLSELELQPMQAGDAVSYDPGVAERCAAGGPTFTARSDAGRVLLCAGMIENHAHYASAWAMLATGKGADMLALTRATRRVLEASRYRRIDITVRAGFKAGEIWARMLGFTREGTFGAWAPDGEDVDVYAIVRKDI